MSAALVDDAARRVVHGALDRLTGGRVTVVEPGSTRHFGDLLDDRYGRVALRARVHVHDPRTYRRILRAGTTGLGESYADGWWDADDLTRPAAGAGAEPAPHRSRRRTGAAPLGPG